VSLWIQVDTQRSSNRKTYVLAELLSRGAGDLFGGRDDVAWLAVAIALLDDFWAWAAEHHPNGDVTDAHPTSIRKALLHWLAGTEWAHKDARDLLVRSGHIDRRPDGRMLVHDWLEWTGGSVLKLAKDRKRKRLARAKGTRTRPRTDIRKGRGHSTPGPALAVQGSAVLSSPVQSSTKTAAAVDYPTRCVIAVNQVLSERLAGAYRSLTSAEHGDVAIAWDAAGIPLELAIKVLTERAWEFRATPLNRQPHTLRYFDGAVREAWAKAQADAQPGGATDKDYLAMRAAAAAEREREQQAGR
jgi:hypothetical protein